MQKIYTLIRLYVAIFIIASGSQTLTLADTINDAQITAKIKAKLLLEKDIPSTELKISTKDGIVFLEGQVDTQLQSGRIIELIFSVRGVQDIDITKYYVNSEYSSTLEDFMTTAKVSGKIRSLEESGDISSNYYTRVETFNGEVHIWGEVENPADRKVIHTMVSRIKGVKKVHLNLKLIK